MSEPASYRIGQIAAQAGVSTRTLRYYEELGLLAPSGHSPGGARRYDDDGVQRLLRVRELQTVMGFNLDQIKVIVASEARLRELKREYHRGGRTRQRELLTEAMELNDLLRGEVRDKLTRTQGFLEDLDAKAVRYRTVLHDLDGERTPTG
jgi:MerR family transcriptional regulator, repressor of the yfmOP operon